MAILKVESLCKSYPAFELKNVGFSLEAGKITGFIGRNGAGKSTTLNCMFDLVHPDSGEVRFFDMLYSAHEKEIKQRVGFVSGAVNFYPQKKLRLITKITSSFYPGWDETAYRGYMQSFKLDENKTPSQLSEGMKVKYALALALSHRAELLILDEPTSGLDPVSRDELLDLFMELCDSGKTILFSTHIITDLDKCADNIIYIKNGAICHESTIADFEGAYRLVEFSGEAPREELLIGKKRSKTGFTALIRAQDAPECGLPCEKAGLESIMLHLEKEG